MKTIGALLIAAGILEIGAAGFVVWSKEAELPRIRYCYDKRPDAGLRTCPSSIEPFVNAMLRSAWWSMAAPASLIVLGAALRRG